MEIQQYIKDYTTLTKPKVNLLLVITALSAIFLASENLPSIQVLIAVIVGGTFASGGAGAINHSIDKDIDNTMKRTSKRPVAGERISKLNAGTPLRYYYYFPSLVSFGMHFDEF